MSEPSMHPLPLVAVAVDVKVMGIHPFHAVGEKYINAVAHGSGCLPLLVPALGAGRDLESLLERVDLQLLLQRLDGLFLPGSPSNVEPSHYGGEPSLPGTHHDTQRDATTLALIRLAVDQGVPVFGVCRGFQEMNVALGGTLHQRVQDLPGMLDHREDPQQPREIQYGVAHTVKLVMGGFLASLVDVSEVQVNSLHAQGIDRLAEGLTVEAVAPDGLVEAFRVRDAQRFAVGVQWHAEWRYQQDAFSRALFAAFGEAVRDRAQERQR